MAVDRSWLREQVEWYATTELPVYDLYASLLESVLTAGARRVAPLAIVQARAKSVTSFSEKAVRKRSEGCESPVMEFTDLCGARVIVHSLAEVDRVRRLIEARFVVDSENSVDVSTRLGTSEFGYASLHYIVQIDLARLRRGEALVPPTEESRSTIATIGERKAEIQVRTLLQHVWADAMHDRSYKARFEVPNLWKRESARLAAVLEEADRAISRITRGIDAYETDLGAYMSDRQIDDEIVVCKAVLDACRRAGVRSESTTHRLGVFLMTRGKWEEASRVLAGVRTSSDSRVIRDRGIALCRTHDRRRSSAGFKDGVRALERALSLDPGDAVTVASLARHLGRRDRERVRAMYETAYETRPDDPYLLAGYLEHRLAEDPAGSSVALMRPTIRAAIARCRDHAAVGVNVPQAWRTIAVLHLVLGEQHDALGAFCRAIERAQSMDFIEASMPSAERLDGGGEYKTGAGWTRRLLDLGAATRFDSAAARRRVRAISGEHFDSPAAPIVIIAGTGEQLARRTRSAWGRLLREAFAEYDGTIIGGGTTAGVSGLVGDLGEAASPRIRTVGYAPKRIPKDVTIDRRYADVRRTPGRVFSPLEPLQMWADLLASGIDPARVRLIGLGGGAVAAAEYRIAVTLGAPVGIVEGSGGAADELASDADWLGVRNLAVLPDGESVRAFVELARPRLAPADRDRLGMLIHAKYRATRFEDVAREKVEMREWGDLPEGLRESNRQQADDIERKLRAIGCGVRRCGERPGRVEEFTPAEIERMAEMEHARWVVERGLEGWRRADTKDVDARRSPSLLAWEELTEAVRSWDRRAVESIPRLLASVDMEIYRIANAVESVARSTPTRSTRRRPGRGRASR